MPNAALAVSQITGSIIFNFTDSVASFKKSVMGLIFTKALVAPAAMTTWLAGVAR